MENVINYMIKIIIKYEDMSFKTHVIKKRKIVFSLFFYSVSKLALNKTLQYSTKLVLLIVSAIIKTWFISKTGHIH